MKSPAVSVIMPTYNHAAFVEQSIRSVLQQRDIDFELLIADDGSVDHTREVIASIRDDRIQFFPNTVNRGACVVTNELIKRASGEFIALINSDDYWIEADKLAFQIQIMKANQDIGACFGRACFVDKDGMTIDKSNLSYGHLFDEGNRSRGRWLRHFFDVGNCICHPTMLIRKSCYEELGMYDNRLRQLPDFDMWIRLLKRYDIHVSNREMIAFRQLPGESASTATPVNIRRILNETYFILERFFDGIPRDVFLDGFGDQVARPDLPDEIHLTIEHALLYLAKKGWGAHIYKLIGLEKIHFLLGSDKHRSVLINHYGIDDRTFHSMAADVNTLDLGDLTGRLCAINGMALIAEVKRRFALRTLAMLRTFSGRFLKKFL